MVLYRDFLIRGQNIGYSSVGGDSVILNNMRNLSSDMCSNRIKEDLVIEDDEVSSLRNKVQNLKHFQANFKYQNKVHTSLLKGQHKNRASTHIKQLPINDHSILSEEVQSDCSFEVEPEIGPSDDHLKSNLITKYINSPLNQKIKNFNDHKETVFPKSLDSSIEKSQLVEQRGNMSSTSH